MIAIRGPLDLTTEKRHDILTSYGFLYELRLTSC